MTDPEDWPHYAITDPEDRPACEANGCSRSADLAFIGEGGDLYLCVFHGGAGDIEGWTWIGSEPNPTDVAELMADEWPIDLMWIEWHQRYAMAEKLLKMLRSNGYVVVHAAGSDREAET